VVKSTTARRRIISSPGALPVKMPVSSTGLGDPATLLPQRKTTERARRVGEWLEVVWRREWEIM
jgi:hypothetical protein